MYLHTAFTADIILVCPGETDIACCPAADLIGSGIHTGFYLAAVKPVGEIHAYHFLDLILCVKIPGNIFLRPDPLVKDLQSLLPVNGKRNDPVRMVAALQPLGQNHRIVAVIAEGGRGSRLCHDLRAAAWTDIAVGVYLSG